MGTQEFHELADQIVAGNKEIRAAIETVGAETTSEVLNGKSPWRRALAERAVKLSAAGNQRQADWLCLLAAAEPADVRRELEALAPSERGAKALIAQRRRALGSLDAEERARIRAVAIAALGELELAEVMRGRKTYARLVEIASDIRHERSVREAAVELAADDYDAVREAAGIPTYAEQRERGQRMRGLRELGDRMGALRQTGVAEEALREAIERVGAERVEAARRDVSVPFGRTAVQLASDSREEATRNAWLVIGAAGPRRCARLAGGREVWVRCSGELGEQSLPAALERIRQTVSKAATETAEAKRQSELDQELFRQAEELGIDLSGVVVA